MRTTQQPNIKWVYAIGVPTVLAIAALFASTIWVIGYYVYVNYLAVKPTPEPIVQADPSRSALEMKHRELLKKAGFRNDVNLGAVTTPALKRANHELEKALRSGK